MTCDAIAARLGIPPNQLASRMQELWEEGRAAVLRERGQCGFNVCQAHSKSNPHKPFVPCAIHGKIRKGRTRRGRLAGLWAPVGLWP